MDLKVKQVSSLEKIRTCGIGDVKLLSSKTIMKGETFSYQLAIETAYDTEFQVEIESPIKECVTVYSVRNINMDFPVYSYHKEWTIDDDYITKEPGLMPDMLIPLNLDGNAVRFNTEAGAIWIQVNVPEDIAADTYPITVNLTANAISGTMQISKTLNLKVINATLPKQTTTFTQWFHTDCIADVHNVEIYSEKHWDLIDKYMALASDLGINMILTPIITPPLDTGEGVMRPCTQLVKIEKSNGKYNFDFSLLKRWIDLINKNNIKYIEMAHLFSQWGLKYAPNIKVTENGKEDYMFGWHVSGQSEEYKDFLTQFLPTLIDFLKSEGVKERTWFHLSDEPRLEHIEAYKYAHDLVKPLIDGCSMLDALSNYDFYKEGLVENPVTATNHLGEFLDKDIKNQWVYYCCVQCDKVGNRFMAMPSYRGRILGLQLYKYNIKGFLQWGYNFYYSQYSKKVINPYITSSAEKAFPSGDSFSVYPITNGVTPSLRAVIFKEALNDVEICRKLESYIGRKKVVEMIDEAAGMDVTFSQYPRNPEYIPSLMEKMEKMIEAYSK